MKPMRAMVLEAAGSPLEPRERERPRPEPGQVLLRVEACGVCRTDLHLLDGELPYIMGQYMVLKRDALRAIGGLKSAEGQLVDDMYIGARMRAAGYTNRVAPMS